MKVKISLTQGNDPNVITVGELIPAKTEIEIDGDVQEIKEIIPNVVKYCRPSIIYKENSGIDKNLEALWST